MAKVDALLWLVNHRPLLETLPRGDEDYAAAELRSSLRENHGAPETLGGQAVFGQLRDLFKEHAFDGKYTPDLKLVALVLAAVAESLLDADAAPADVALDMPTESSLWSPMPATAVGPAAPLHAGMKGAAAALSAAGTAAAGLARTVAGGVRYLAGSRLGRFSAGSSRLSRHLARRPFGRNRPTLRPARRPLLLGYCCVPVRSCAH